MRTSLVLLSVFAAPLLHAQLPLPPLVVTQQLTGTVQRLETDVNDRTAILRRDAFIVGRLVAATAALNDFQKLAAIEKARNEVDAAMRRAAEKPPAPRPTMELLDAVAESLGKARLQGTMADLEAVKKDILRRSGFLQTNIFQQLDQLRRARVALLDAQTKLALMTGSIDEAMTEALTSTFDYFRAGGQ
ncbi:MAG TPA: hypothetical protein VF698_21550 [Thermoanaerobaculia bacterium]|jgi:hypothetical protein